MSLKREIGQAVSLYESFREASPRRVAKIRVKPVKAVAIIGYVEAVDYRTTHGKKVELYRHDFAAGSRPLLAVSADGKQLLLLGGRYQFTEQGIVDKDASGKLITNPGHGKAINPRGRRKNARTLDVAEGQAITSYARLHRLPASIVSTMRILYMNDPALWSKRGLSKLETEVRALARKGNPGLRQKDVFAQIRALGGMTVKRDEAGEFRVTFTGIPKERAEELAYYTDDLDDLLSTAQDMKRRQQGA